MFWKKKKQHERMPSAVYIFGNKKRSELPMTHWTYADYVSEPYHSGLRDLTNV